LNPLLSVFGGLILVRLAFGPDIFLSLGVQTSSDEEIAHQKISDKIQQAMDERDEGEER
jgi:hypothetical protein